MKSRIIAALLIVDRLGLELRDQLIAISGDSVPPELAMQAMCVAESRKLLAGAGQFTYEERAQQLLNAGWPRAEVEAMVELVRAQDRFAATIKKTEKTQLN